jgi:phage terminase large subunit-like protein
MDIVTQYAHDIVDGKIIAGKLIKIAAFRHLRDLKRQSTKEFQYHFDTEILDGFLRFASQVPDPDTGEPMPLMPWEIFILGSVIAWRNDKTGGKRFRRAIVSIARGQGKTYIAAILAAYDFFVQSYGKNNQDIIASANTADQTKKLYNYIKGSISRLLDTIFDWMKPYTAINYMETVDRQHMNQIVRISAEGGKYDSYHAATAIFDEAGDQRDREAFGKITSGQIKQEEALFFLISTAYQNPNAPLREDIRTWSEAIENDIREFDDSFLAVFAQDGPEEVFQPDTWIKSNPLLGLPDQHDKLMTGLLSERNTKIADGTLPDFLVKNMNIWLNAEQNAAFNLDEVQQAVVASFDMNERDVYIGFDNSMTSDDAAFAFVFPYVDGDKQRWHIYQHSFIPWHKAGSIETKEKQDGINYRHMQDLGYASVTEHEKGLIDNDFMFTWLTDFVEQHHLNVKFFLYDAAHTYAFIKAVEEATTWDMVGVRQGALSLNEPTKWLQDAFVEGRVSRLDDPMMEKSLMNAVIVSDNNGIKIDKNKATYKIDLVDAIIDALSEAINHFEDFARQGSGNEYDKMTEKQINEFIGEEFSF